MLILAFIALAILVILFLAIALYICSIFPYGVMAPPFIPSSSELHGLIATELGASPESVVYDLGSGNAAVLLAAWRQEPHARYIGIEKHFFPRTWARLKCWRTESGARIELRDADIFETDLRPATHVFCYLFPQPMQRLLPKFQNELRPGALVISLDFPLEAKEPERVIDLSSYRTRTSRALYVYRF